jgi:hypothetical protein
VNASNANNPHYESDITVQLINEEEATAPDRMGARERFAAGAENEEVDADGAEIAAGDGGGGRGGYHRYGRGGWESDRGLDRGGRGRGGFMRGGGDRDVSNFGCFTCGAKDHIARRCPREGVGEERRRWRRRSSAGGGADHRPLSTLSEAGSAAGGGGGGGASAG